MGWIEMSVAIGCGILIGLLYFGGLWWTVNQLPETERPLAFYLTSVVVRMAIIAACLVLTLQFGVAHLVLAVVGFFAARLFLVYRSSIPKRTQFNAKAAP